MATGRIAPPARDVSRASSAPSSPPDARTRRRVLAVAGGLALVVLLVAFAILSSAVASPTLATIILAAMVIAGALTVVFVLRGLWLAARRGRRPTIREMLVVLVASGITGFFTILQMIQAWQQLPLH